ncbi:acyclic terpene utilization AtuA family protein [Sphingopyxis sp. SCN 67-31]|uniref:acyclic terpene utilization AtuA family protein n=1 Tax=Sphingopyxis sp. SCN 67-31 TaxID=1660142 RepID=UPI00086AB987|nr:acyclic terpene utilization AtuA family protein [Sphingopyxis sp. SCN 67-31]ODU27249.1 MAG: hypothetical protein ABS88_16765 [Sphingopyxis sp. SCN 67-31]
MGSQFKVEKPLEEVRFVAATGMVGVGIDEPKLMKSLETKPHFIACDAGTTDAGPFALGSGRAAFPRAAIKSDMAAMLRAGNAAGIPVLVGSVGTAGADVHVDWMVDIVREILAEQGWVKRVAVLKSQQDPAYLKSLYRAGRIEALNPAPAIDEDIFDRSSRVVGMMGVEPLQAALAEGADIVIAGRCSDPALFAAFPIMHGLPEGLSWHAGKVAECGPLACETSGKGIILGMVRQDEMVIDVIGDGLRCTPLSVAAHSLYESSDPYLHTECSGILDLSHATFEQASETGVRVRGSGFRDKPFTVKLEGAEQVGYQSIMIGGVRDPYILRQLDEWLDTITAHVHHSVARVLGDAVKREDYRIVFHVYGKNAVMGALETELATPHEVGIVTEVTAPTQDLATQIVKLCRQPLLHAPIPEWKGAITGFACLHNPAEIERGPVWRFNLNHVVRPDDWRDMFRLDIQDMGESK